MRAGVLQLSRWGLLDRSSRPAPRRCGSTIFHYADRAGAGVRSGRAPGVDALYAPRRTCSTRSSSTPPREAGAEVRYGTTVTGLLRDGDGRVAGVVARAASGGEPRRIAAGVVIGADGIALGGRRGTSGAPVVPARASRGAVLYRYFADLPADGYEWAYGAGAAAGADPHQRRADLRVRRRHARTACDGCAGRAPTRAFARCSARPRPARPTGVRARRTGRPAPRLGRRPGYLRRSWGPGWALVGDAGYFKDPISAHGMTDALRDAELLADALLRRCPGRCPRPSRSAALPGARGTGCRAPLFAATDRIAAYDWDLALVQALLREVSSAMSDEVELLEGLSAPGQAPRPARTSPDMLAGRQ